MSRLMFACLLLCLALVVDAQQAERTTGSDVTDEEPHPYTISFFLFPRQQTVELDDKGKSKNATEHDKSNSTQAEGKHPSESPQDDDPDLSYQHGSVKHPAHEMYPMCHHCPKNSSYEECVHKRTLKRCDNGLSNICFTKSTKRDKIVHYHMGCANHKECKKARAKPCKAHEKRCFTCCQWSGCNSMSHHEDTTAFSLWDAGHAISIGWGSLGVSLVTFIMMYFI
ncbi:uncharacterized protein LOC110056621 [Orbicella faveolata]|uniref:uncharacterized protein LOC110056621 n=1 Tax=Orbicella faveolata TaxID=48498 RepID=UPI0009E594A9|nr:uncharacterized protein LOC110056621 [Orbicella faveolata]XP_020618899.1 uncharacterized protein LOC110056621 [Orbicella faveolata]XP_020618979.1 uncharacterized protein LOC110056621 [Orbicella faveolata]XP_020619051.1 uncharacterized protein LOC110056621 [Orbicella faveolata]XP_020619119.1 uncharacterized protein LOC110056621 [Orbicella faveolata]